MACGPSGSADGGPEPDDGASGTGRITVDFAVAPSALPAGVTLDSASVGLSELRARSDRAGELDPAREGLGLVNLATDTTIAFDAAPPATYGRLTMHVEAGDWGPALDLRIEAEEGTLEVVDQTDVSVDVRCADVVTLLPGGELSMHVRLDVASLYDALRSQPLPPAGEDGVIQVNAETDAAALDALSAQLVNAWSLTCEMHNP